MKNNFLILLSIFGLLFIACDKDDDEMCHPCHIAYEVEHKDECCATDGGECCTDDHNHDHGEHEHIEVEIGVFCGADLVAAESEGYEYVLESDVSVEHEGETIIVPADTYGNGNMEIHCEEHADH